MSAQLYRLESEYPFAGAGYVHTAEEWKSIYGYEVDRHAANIMFTPLNADSGPRPALPPWRVSEEGNVWSADGKRVANVCHKADSDLIASAPELLEALEKIAARPCETPTLDKFPYTNPCSTCIARQALAKMEAKP